MQLLRSGYQRPFAFATRHVASFCTPLLEDCRSAHSVTRHTKFISARFKTASMNSMKPVSSSKPAGAAAKAASAGASPASPSRGAALPSNKAASLAFLMSLDQSAATVHAKPNDTPKVGHTPVPPVAAAPSSSAAISKPEKMPPMPQLFKSTNQIKPPGAVSQQGQVGSGQLAVPGQSRSVGASTAAAAVADAAPSAQPSRVRQRSDEDHISNMNPSALLQPLSSASPRMSSLLGPEHKRRKSNRTWKMKVTFIEEHSKKAISHKLDGKRFLGCKLPATLKFQFNTLYTVRITVDHSLEFGLNAQIKTRSPVFFEDAYDTADAVPIATSDPLILCKGTPLSWGQDVYEGNWRCMAEPVESTQRAQLTMELSVLGHGDIQIPFLAKIYEEKGHVFGHHPSEGLILGSATFDIEAAAFSGVLQVGAGAYSPPEPQSAGTALVEVLKERRTSAGGGKAADAKLLLALAAVGAKGK